MDNEKENALRESDSLVRRKMDVILSRSERLGLLELSDIIDPTTLQAMMDDLKQITGICMSIIDRRGRILVTTGGQDICGKFHRVHPETIRKCLESDVTLSEGVALGEFKLYRCKNNMWDMVTPIAVGGNHIANLFSGQFLLDNEAPDYELFTQQARQYGFNEQEYLSALDRIPRLNKKKVEQVMAFYAKFAVMVSSWSYNNLQLSRTLSEKDTLLNKLEQSEEKHRAILENAAEGISVAQDGMLKFVNPKIEEILGLTKEELTSRPFVEFIHPDDRTMVLDRHIKRLQGMQVPSRYAFRIVARTGDTRWVELNVVSIVWEGKAATLNFMMDVSDRLRAEEALQAAREELERKVEERTFELSAANEKLTHEVKVRKRYAESLRESEEKYRTILSSIEEGYYEVDLTGNLTFFNDSLCRISGYIADEILGMHRRDYPLKGSAGPVFDVFKHVYKTGEPAGAVEYTITRKDGEERTLEITTSLMRDSEGRATGFRGIVRDITERKEAEKLIHRLSRELMNAHEAERRKVSYELHDGLAQDLFAIKTNLDTLLDRWMGAPPEVKAKAQDISKTIQRSIREIRNMAYSLRPETLEDLGLVRTLLEYCEEFTDRTGIQVDFKAAGMEDAVLDFEMSISVFRMIQEALTNIKKHAGATAASIKMVGFPSHIILRITDNGKGFDPAQYFAPKAAEQGMGLQIMKERASLLHGTMKVESNPNSGTSIFLEIPL